MAARRRKIAEFRAIKAEIKRVKEKLHKKQQKLAASRPKSRDHKRVKSLLSQLKSAYYKLGNIEPF